MLFQGKKLLFIFFLVLYQLLELVGGGLSFAKNAVVIDSLEQALQITQEDTAKIEILNSLSWQYRNTDFDKALLYAKEALSLSENLNIKLWISTSMNNMGHIYTFRGDYKNGLKYYLSSLKLREEINDKRGVAKSLNNIGTVQFYQGNPEGAIEYFLKALKILQELNDPLGVAGCSNNIGGILRMQKKLDKALGYFMKALKIAEEIDDKKSRGAALNNIAAIYYDQDNFEKAVEYLFRSLKIKEEAGDKRGIILSMSSLGTAYRQMGNIQKALEYHKRSLFIAKEIGSKPLLITCYENLAGDYEKQNNYKKAFDYYKIYSGIKDTIFNEESSKQIAEMQTKYESEKKQKQIEIQNLKLNKQELELTRNRILQYTLAGGVLMLILLSYFVYSRYRLKQKANEQLAEKNKEITDSIFYAKCIQEALLPLTEEIKDKLPNSFILFKPKDIVSGDFYWFANIGRDGVSSYIIAAVDCTGHGVPGAFMSMLGNAYLNEIVNEKGITKPSEILEKLKGEIIKSLKQKSGIGERQDGMDIALCNLEFLDGQAGIKLQYSGANNPLFVVRNGQLMETMADRQPIGIYVDSKPFTNHILDLQKDDIIYIFSDGYIDQFGGPQAKKYMIKRFKQLLLDIQDKNMQQQKEHLDKTIEDWKGSEGQVDDILVIGIKV